MTYKTGEEIKLGDVVFAPASSTSSPSTSSQKMVRVEISAIDDIKNEVLVLYSGTHFRINAPNLLFNKRAKKNLFVRFIETFKKDLSKSSKRNNLDEYV